MLEGPSWSPSQLPVLFNKGMALTGTRPKSAGLETKSPPSRDSIFRLAYSFIMVF